MPALPLKLLDSHLILHFLLLKNVPVRKGLLTNCLQILRQFLSLLPE